MRAVALAGTLVGACGGRVNFDDAGADAASTTDSAIGPDAAETAVAADAQLDAREPDAAPPADVPAADERPPLDADPPRDAPTFDAPPVDAPAADASACDVGTACTTGAALYCANLNSDPNNCGSCGNRCCPGEACLGGSCGGLGCPAGSIVCGGSGRCRACVDPTSDVSNCGMCGRVCSPGMYCLAGVCVSPCAAVTAAAPPMGVCDGRGMIACQRWAQESAGGNPNATAVCVSSPSGCARADRCDRPDDPSSCHCGSSDPCMPNEVCVLSGPTARCECLRPAM